jgi:hypothetical protein
MVCFRAVSAGPDSLEAGGIGENRGIIVTQQMTKDTGRENEGHGTIKCGGCCKDLKV